MTSYDEAPGPPMVQYLLINSMIIGLKRNKELYGKRYCPCRLEHTDENICFCQEFKQQPVGSTCHCGIYIKTEQ